jgi:hypothetical protein
MENDPHTRLIPSWQKLCDRYNTTIPEPERSGE